MLRRSVTGAVLGVIALTAAACGSSSKSTGSGPTTGAAATTGATATTAAATSGAAASATGSAAPSATGSAAPSATTAGGGTGGGHGGVTLATSTALSTKAGTKALTVENNPIPALEDNFNAFNSNGFGYKLNVEGLFYEPLLMFNDLKPNTAYPWLAKDFAWNTDGTALTFTIRDGVKFSDGKPLTAADVAYTFQVMKDDPAANRQGLPLVGTKIVAPNQVEVDFTVPQFQNIFNIAGQTYVVEASAYKNAGVAADKFADPKPIGTGPYTLTKFSPQGLAFKANPSYWGGTPPVPEVDVPSYSSNPAALTALAQGKIDYAGNFVDQIQTSFVAKDPAHNKYWFPAINVVSLEFNVATGPKALADPAVRKAISLGIDRTKVAGQAEQGYEAPASSSSGLLLPNFVSLLPPTYKNDLQPGIDASGVTSAMTAAGYAKDSKGFWAKGGTEVAFKIEDPSAYTDYYNAAKIMAADFQKEGFNATASGVDANKWYADLAAGTFDTAIHWSNTGPSPYATYDGWLDPALSSGGNATNATGNYGRFVNPEAKAALDAYAKAGTEEQSSAAVNHLAKVMSEQTPVAPIMYAAGWYEYNTKNYSGWVDKNNQFMDPAPNPANVSYVILHLTPNS